MSLYRKLTNYRISSVLWAPFPLKTLLEDSSPARAKHIRRTVKVAGRLLYKKITKSSAMEVGL